jgi:hypothetical protein
MLKPISDAFEVVRTTLSKITKLPRPVSNFILHILPLWLGMNCRMTFLNLGRWGGRNEKTYRTMFKKAFDWLCFNCALVKACLGDRKVIAVFDPSFIKKSGSKTYGRARFWSSTQGRALQGLEIGCLAFVGVSDHTALHGLAEQSPTPQSLKKEGRTLVDHYTQVVMDHASRILALTPYLVVDGYFMKKEFILPVLQKGLQVITKARGDADLRYLYKGRQKTKGRKKLFDGKVNTRSVDRRRLHLLSSNKQRDIFSGVVYSVRLKRPVLAAIIYYKDEKTGAYLKDKKGRIKPDIIISTDTQMKPRVMCHYFELRYQIEFLIRDAKSYAGLQDCQARSQEKLHTHFNLALTSVSVAKAAYFLPLPKKQRGGFSMMDVKMRGMNELIAKRVFSILDIDPSCEKYHHAYQDCLNFGRLRA